MTLKKNNKVLITGRVCHSQRMNETPLKPWVILSPDGVVDCGHCDCMAGLGEVCGHVGSLLFWVDQAHHANKQLTVTQKKAYWPVPSYIDKVTYGEVQAIDFTSAEVKKRQFESAISGYQLPTRSVLKLPMVSEPTDEEKIDFHRKLFNSNVRPAVLSVKSAFQDDYVPDILKDGKLPINLASLRNEKYMKWTVIRF